MSATSSNPVQVKVKGPLRCEGPGRLQWGEDLSSSARVAARFVPLSANGEAAVRSLSQFSPHAALPKVLQTGVWNDEAFAVLDFPQGRLLGSTLEHPLELRRLLRMGHDIADALAAAHAEGIAHGELSAQSVLLLGEEQAMLWDLPLVLVDRLTDRRGEGRVLQKLEQTAELLSPERARGQPASAAADVWALGALLCRAAGSPRPMAPSTLGVVHQIASGTWAPRIPERFPARIRALLSGMLAPEPSARLLAAAVKSELAAILEEATTLKDLPAVEHAPVRMPSTGEDGDLVEMLRPEPPRSALPDAHAAPTLADREGEAVLSQALNLPSSPEVPVTGAQATGPLVPWTDPRVHAIVDPDLATVAHPLPKEEPPLPVLTLAPKAEVKSEVVMRIGAGAPPRMAPLHRVVSLTGSGEAFDAGLEASRSLRRIVLTAAVALPVVAMIALGIMATLPWTRVNPPPPRTAPLTWETKAVTPAATKSLEAATRTVATADEAPVPPVPEVGPQPLETTARFVPPKPARHPRAKKTGPTHVEAAPAKATVSAPPKEAPAEKTSELKHLF
ncbi:MAG: protein kinase [Myxococcaceae bacterium]|nr:protein kinase [Myxococcaceae bacterium]